MKKFLSAVVFGLFLSPCVVTDTFATDLNQELLEKQIELLEAQIEELNSQIPESEEFYEEEDIYNVEDGFIPEPKIGANKYYQRQDQTKSYHTRVNKKPDNFTRLWYHQNHLPTLQEKQEINQNNDDIIRDSFYEGAIPRSSRTYSSGNFYQFLPYYKNKKIQNLKNNNALQMSEIQLNENIQAKKLNTTLQNRKYKKYLNNNKYGIVKPNNINKYNLEYNQAKEIFANDFLFKQFIKSLNSKYNGEIIEWDPSFLNEEYVNFIEKYKNNEIEFFPEEGYDDEENYDDEDNEEENYD